MIREPSGRSMRTSASRACGIVPAQHLGHRALFVGQDASVRTNHPERAAEPLIGVSERRCAAPQLGGAAVEFLDHPRGVTGIHGHGTEFEQGAEALLAVAQGRLGLAAPARSVRAGGAMKSAAPRSSRAVAAGSRLVSNIVDESFIVLSSARLFVRRRRFTPKLKERLGPDWSYAEGVVQQSPGSPVLRRTLG